MKQQILILLMIITPFCYSQDKKGCENAEPSYINRLAGFSISECEESEFKEHTFVYYTGSPAKAITLVKGGKYRKII